MTLQNTKNNSSRNLHINTMSKSEQQPLIANLATKKVWRARFLVFGIMLLATALASVSVYWIAQSSNQKAFVASFEGSAEKVIGGFHEIVADKVTAMASLGVAATADGISQVQSGGRGWPFVHTSNLQQRARSVRELSDFLFLFFIPVVTDEHRGRYEKFTMDNMDWMYDGAQYQEDTGINQLIPHMQNSSKSQLEELLLSRAKKSIAALDPVTFASVVDPGPGPYMPIGQSSPILINHGLNLNMLHIADAPFVQACVDTKEAVLGPIFRATAGDIHHENMYTAHFASLLSIAAKRETSYGGDPMSSLYLPVFDSFGTERELVAVISAQMHWARYFKSILPPHTVGVTIVLKNCNQAWTYEINGADVRSVGEGDLHEPKFNEMVQSATFNTDDLDLTDGSTLGIKLNQNECPYTLLVYPSSAMEMEFIDHTPLGFAAAISVIFAFTLVMFFVYDRLVERRQQVTLETAAQSTAVVSSLFPERFRERVLNAKIPGGSSTSGSGSSQFMSAGNRVRSFLDNGSNGEVDDGQICEVFPEATVMVANLKGFAAWSSSRHPTAVFTLLESIFQAFDKIATQRGVFSVECIGDSYVAVAGLPNPQPRHAEIMARFAWQCSTKMKEVVKDLDLRLGPGTSDLACMESTGAPNKIHASEATARLLQQAGKANWVRERKDAIVVKGVGKMPTFWIKPKSSPMLKRDESAEQEHDRTDLCPTDLSCSSLDYEEDRDLMEDRLILWMTELLMERSKPVVAKHIERREETMLTFHRDPNKTNLDEVAQIIELPKFAARMAFVEGDVSKVVIPSIVARQMRDYVSTIAGYYQNAPFHSFQHCCHVTMSVDKFLKRIVSPDLGNELMSGTIESNLHDFTHGITSDPLTHLAIVWSALIHDCDHRGISNAQLCKEEKQMAEKYRGKSVAEQNSLDISWDLLMSDNFIALRKYLFASQTELLRFRQVLINVVLATDIFDKELNDLRKNRWQKAFAEGSENDPDHNGLRAAIVIEHIIQASDVSHTYTAELQFFDNYIIPLANKLAACGVFGASSFECLNYAIQNRAEWEMRGEELVAEMVEELRSQTENSDEDQHLVAI